MIVSAVLLVMAYASGFTDAMVSTILNWAYVLCAVAVVCILVMPFFYKSGKTSKNTVIGIAAFVIACVVSYLCASDAMLQQEVAVEYTANTVKWTDAGLILSCLLLAGVVLSVIGGVVMNMIRK